MQVQHSTPLGALARGLVAGLIGTAVMTAYQTVVQRLQKNGQGENDDGGKTWEGASAPAKVGKRVLEGVFREPVGEDRIPVLEKGMHWGYGTSWGAVYGLAQETFRGNPVGHGLAFGVGVWGMSYAQLVPMKLYEPPWKYPLEDLAVDLSYHLVYGLGVAGAHRLIAGR